MRIAYFNCFSGISGDMTLGALLDAGLSFDDLRQGLESLNIHGYDICANKVTKSGFAATKVDVNVKAKQPHRHLGDIEKIIGKSKLSDIVKNKAIAVFDRLAEAEAKVHQTTKKEIHFHEVGAVDAIVDVVGCMLGLELLGIDKVYSSPISLGSGTVVCQHGEIPVPAPATVELLKGFPVRMTGVEVELTTPTGAALITAITNGFSDIPVMSFNSVGHGAGGRELQERPNILRVFIGEAIPEIESDQVMLVETNIDDMSPEILAYAPEKLLQAGALDVYITPVIMKKGRPGQKITVLVHEEKLSIIEELLFTETSTIGVRMSRVERRKLPRETKIVETEFGNISVKLVRYQSLIRISPEYDDCKKMAIQHGVPLSKVYQSARKAFEEINHCSISSKVLH